ncbi:MAG: MXAN_5187 C-terminal domain-containing protein [Vicinamibacterales bacterium]
MSQPPDIARDLNQLTSDLKQLEAEYNMFFAGRLPRPPWETRARVDALLKRWDRGRIETSVDRFSFQSIQSRFSAFAALWDRGQRAREEGRPGPFVRPTPRDVKDQKEQLATSGILHVTAFSDPMKEMDKLQTLYDTLMDARRERGDEAVPFHKFAALIKNQVAQFREGGSAEVAFRVAVKDGKVSFTARGLMGGSE